MSAKLVRRVNEERQQVHLELTIQRRGPDVVQLTQIMNTLTDPNVLDKLLLDEM